MSNSKRIGHKGAVALVVVILGVVFGLIYITDAKGVQFKPFTESDVLAIVTSMFVVAVFMERSIEAVLTPIRTRDRQLIERDIEDLQNAVKEDATKQKELTAKKHELASYRLDTAQRAYWLSFGFGLLISLVGIRTLSGLVRPEDLDALKGMNGKMFSFVDVMLTGGVISGGSAAINKIARAISGFFKLKSATDSKQLDESST